ncbi:MAG: hypothetical protein AAGI14_00020 [Pseudomonadota bacterium]
MAEQPSPDLWQRVIAAVIAGLVTAALIAAFLIYLIGFKFGFGVILTAFGIGAFLAIIHGVKSKSVSVGMGVLGAFQLVVYGFGAAVAGMAALIATALTSFSI